jgi:type I restriction enzyme S subunit
LIKSDYFHQNKDVFASGSTQVSLTNEGFHMIKLVEPPIDLIKEYGNITYSFFEEINLLINKNEILKETRDLMLPRLISGKLSVEDIDLENLNS